MATPLRHRTPQEPEGPISASCSRVAEHPRTPAVWRYRPSEMPFRWPRRPCGHATNGRSQREVGGKTDQRWTMSAPT